MHHKHFKRKHLFFFSLPSKFYMLVHRFKNVCIIIQGKWKERSTIDYSCVSLFCLWYQWIYIDIILSSCKQHFIIIHKNPSNILIFVACPLFVDERVIVCLILSKNNERISKIKQKPPFSHPICLFS